MIIPVTGDAAPALVFAAVALLVIVIAILGGRK